MIYCSRMWFNCIAQFGLVLLQLISLRHLGTAPLLTTPEQIILTTEEQTYSFHHFLPPFLTPSHHISLTHHTTNISLSQLHLISSPHPDTACLAALHHSKHSCLTQHSISSSRDSSRHSKHSCANPSQQIGLLTHTAHFSTPFLPHPITAHSVSHPSTAHFPSL